MLSIEGHPLGFVICEQEPESTTARPPEAGYRERGPEKMPCAAHRRQPHCHPGTVITSRASRKNLALNFRVPLIERVKYRV